MVWIGASLNFSEKSIAWHQIAFDFGAGIGLPISKGGVSAA
jgi:hypothetical protein